MANYPLTAILPQIEGTVVLALSGKDVYRSASGKPRVRTYYTAVREDVVIKHYLDETQRGTLESFYTTNQNIAFTFTYAADGDTYSCYFTSAPKFIPRTGGYYDVTVTAVVA
jgi:hypothetical protein